MAERLRFHLDENVDPSVASALRQDPTNTELAALLATTYRKEIDLLQDILQLPASPGGDTQSRSRI